MRLEEGTAVAILNLVLALGCQYQSRKEPGLPHTEAEVFFDRAHALIKFDPVETSNVSVPLLQLMLLMTQYLMGTGNTHKSWGIIGMAVRCCHQLGLHRNATYNETALHNPLDRNLAKRVYHGCLMLER